MAYTLQRTTNSFQGLKNYTDPRNDFTMFPFGQHLQQELPQLYLAIVPGPIALMRCLNAVVGDEPDRFDGRLLHQHWSATDNRSVGFHRLHVLVVSVVVADVSGDGGHLKASQQFDMREKHVLWVLRNFLVELLRSKETQH